MGCGFSFSEVGHTTRGRVLLRHHELALTLQYSHQTRESYVIVHSLRDEELESHGEINVSSSKAAARLKGMQRMQYESMLQEIESGAAMRLREKSPRLFIDWTSNVPLNSTGYGLCSSLDTGSFLCSLAHNCHIDALLDSLRGQPAVQPPSELIHPQPAPQPSHVICSVPIMALDTPPASLRVSSLSSEAIQALQRPARSSVSLHSFSFRQAEGQASEQGPTSIKSCLDDHALHIDENQSDRSSSTQLFRQSSAFAIGQQKLLKQRRQKLDLRSTIRGKIHPPDVDSGGSAASGPPVPSELSFAVNLKAREHRSDRLSNAGSNLSPCSSVNTRT
jgi:hypothetical protein